MVRDRRASKNERGASEQLAGPSAIDRFNTPAVQQRDAYRELIDKIELRFEKTPRGKRTECPLQSGFLYLRTGEGMASVLKNRVVRV
jgi:hypothetical protein